jgi:hypothetical protein
MPDAILSAFVSRGWDAHAADPAALALRLEDTALALGAGGPAAARQALARLAHHVHGEHLGRWTEGIAWQQRLAALPALADDHETAAAVHRHAAALALAGGLPPPPGTADAADAAERVRVAALAAASLAPHDVARAAVLFRQALDQHEAAALAGTSPATRALAVTGNNLACELEERASRSEAERALMILAAQAARRCWALAGTWLETERAEYRLAHTRLKAGDPAQARVHAQACLDLVAANGNPALECFLGLEALALAAAAQGDAATHGASVAGAQAAFAELPADDQAWCRGSLLKLAPGTAT